MKKRREISVTFANGHQIQTEINGAEDEIIAYYRDNSFNVGRGGEDDLQVVAQIKFIDTPDGASWTNPALGLPLQSAVQSPEVEAKIAQLLAQAAGERDPDLLAEIDQMSDAIARLGDIKNEMSRDNSAYALGRNHVVQYYGFNNTALELEMLYLLLDGKSASAAYRMAVDEKAPDSLELAMQAAAVARDRAILAKEERKDADMARAQASGLEAAPLDGGLMP